MAVLRVTEIEHPVPFKKYGGFHIGTEKSNCFARCQQGDKGNDLISKPGRIFPYLRKIPQAAA
jgi:hypothetical protein